MQKSYTKEVNKIALTANNDTRIQSICSIKIYASGQSKDLTCKNKKIKCDNIVKQYNKLLTLMILQENIQKHNPIGQIWSSLQEVFCKKGFFFFKIHRKTPLPVSFLIELQAESSNFIKKETLAQVFSCEKNLRTTLFIKHL